jgi:sarcosine oxidase subunit gamma
MAEPSAPLAARGTAFAGLPTGVRVEELPFLTQLDLRVDPDGPAGPEIATVLGGTLPTQPCTAVRLGDVDVLWLAPREWLLLAAPGRQEELASDVRTALGVEPGAVVDVSAQRTTLRLTGAQARAVLARGCAIDLDPRVASPGTCVQTNLARTGVTIVVQDETASDFLVLVRSSYADSLAAWLVDACTEL